MTTNYINETNKEFNIARNMKIDYTTRSQKAFPIKNDVLEVQVKNGKIKLEKNNNTQGNL